MTRPLSAKPFESKGPRRKQPEHGVAQAIVHGRVEPVAADHPQKGAVLLPGLADEQCLRVGCLGNVTECLPVSVREAWVAGDIQTPAAGALVQPVFGNTVRPGQEIFLHGRSGSRSLLMTGIESKPNQPS